MYWSLSRIIKSKLIPKVYYYKDDLYEAFCETSHTPVTSSGVYPFSPYVGGTAIIIRDEMSKTRKLITLLHEYVHHILFLLFGWNNRINKVINYSWEIVAVILKELFFNIRRTIRRIKQGHHYYTKYYWEKKNESKCEELKR